MKRRSISKPQSSPAAITNLIAKPTTSRSDQTAENSLKVQPGFERTKTGLLNMPTELALKILENIEEPVDRLALLSTNKRFHMLEGSKRESVVDAVKLLDTLDGEIRTITNQTQYQAALLKIKGIPQENQAKRLEEVIYKSNHSGRRSVDTFKELVDAASNIPPDYRISLFRPLTQFLRQMEVNNIPLTRDQVAGHQQLLVMASQMTPHLQREALRTLTQSWLPPAAVIAAKAALDTLGADSGSSA